MSEQPNQPDMDLTNEDLEDVEGHRKPHNTDRVKFGDPERKRDPLLEDEDVEGHRFAEQPDIQPQRDEDLGGTDR